MDIKNVWKGVVPPQPKPIERSEKTIKSDSTTDRDGNGQMPFGQGQHHQGPMSDEQLQKCLEHLRDLPSVKEHGWTVELVVHEGRRHVALKDRDGKIIRKIQESELWSLQTAGAKDKGQLIRKTA